MMCFRTRLLKGQGFTVADLCDWSLNRVGEQSRIRVNHDIQPKTVFIRNEIPLIREFFYHHLPHIKSETRFILITGNTDATIPRQLDKRFPNYTNHPISDVIKQIKADQRLVRWFAENCDAPDQIMRPIPTGVVNDCKHAVLRTLLDNRSDISVNMNNRLVKAVCTHRIRQGPQWHKRRMVTDLCLKHWKTSVDYFASIPSNRFIDKLKKYCFVVCVSGGGLDPSPKAFEAILAGCIPIIERSPVYEAYSELPVVAVNRWEPGTITNERLKLWLEQHRSKFEDDTERREVLRRLSMRYWWQHIINPLSDT